VALDLLGLQKEEIPIDVHNMSSSCPAKTNPPRSVTKAGMLSVNEGTGSSWGVLVATGRQGEPFRSDMSPPERVLMT